MRNKEKRKGLTIFLICFVLIPSTFVSFSSSCARTSVDLPSESIKVKSQLTQENGSLSGYVTDTNMSPIEGALVRVYFHGTYREDYSDVTGYYHVIDIPICYCMKEAVCSKEGYYNESVWLSINENTTYDFVLTPIDLACYPVLDGIMGENGWYVSCVNISFVISEPLDALYYKIDGGSWQIYTAPVIITICDDGGHTFMWYYIYQGNESAQMNIVFKIDKTPPEVIISKEKISFNKIRITVEADDPTSGINRAEFYLDGILQETLITPPPYVMFFLLIGPHHKITIMVYDNAGNSETNKITLSKDHNCNLIYMTKLIGFLYQFNAHNLFSR